MNIKECIICLDNNFTLKNPALCFYNNKCSCNTIIHKDCLALNKINLSRCLTCRTEGNLLPINILTGSKFTIIPKKYNKYIQIKDLENPYQCDSFKELLEGIKKGAISLLHICKFLF